MLQSNRVAVRQAEIPLLMTAMLFCRLYPLESIPDRSIVQEMRADDVRTGRCKARLLSALGLTLLMVCAGALAVLAPEVREQADREHQGQIDRYRRQAPEVFDIHVDRTERDGDLYIAHATVLQVIRSAQQTGIGDRIIIEYTDITADNRRYNAELQRTRMPGTGFRPVLWILKRGDRARAYLERRPGSDNKYTLAADSGSFEALPGTAMNGDPCIQHPQGPFTSQMKACARQQYRIAQRELESKLNELKRSLDGLPPDNDPDKLLYELDEQQRKYLASSMTAWEKYRDDTCKIVYLNHYPGSHASIYEMHCLTRLTEERTRQLDTIFKHDPADE